MGSWQSVRSFFRSVLEWLTRSTGKREERILLHSSSSLLHVEQPAGAGDGDGGEVLQPEREGAAGGGEAAGQRVRLGAKPGVGDVRGGGARPGGAEARGEVAVPGPESRLRGPLLLQVPLLPRPRPPRRLPVRDPPPQPPQPLPVAPGSGVCGGAYGSGRARRGLVLLRRRAECRRRGRRFVVVVEAQVGEEGVDVVGAGEEGGQDGHFQGRHGRSSRQGQGQKGNWETCGCGASGGRGKREGDRHPFSSCFTGKNKVSANRCSHTHWRAVDLTFDQSTTIPS
ncbi:hypothetical protein BRADI_4g00812v3 [Brachypodium distachyon]|uniref:Uncharacterized protein n=1 Tax=Brachypodium distachyon TaxID=15368 RepID=A0A0Q3P9L4_BRADI|nr:hypothetical protein BRADI_4g00812v3 [Brachypodium distachyon]